MNLRVVSKNVHEVTYNRDVDKDMPFTTIVLFSFGVAVAARIPDGTFVATTFEHSRTTKQHISKFVEMRYTRFVSQWTIDNIVNLNWDELPKIVSI